PSPAVLRRRGGCQDPGDVAAAGYVDEGGESAQELRPGLRPARQLEQGLDDGGTHAEHQRRRGEVAQGVLRAVAADELGPPDAGRPELAGDLRPGPARPVGDLHVRVEPDASAGGADAQVELPVLSASDAFVEAVEGLEDLTPVDAE